MTNKTGYARHRALAASARARALLAITALLLSPALAADGNEQWVGTWSAALHSPEVFPGQPGNQGFSNQTLRQIVHTSIGGDRVRVRLSTFGAGALMIGAAQIALGAEGSAILPGSDRTLTFGGQPSITIPPGAVALSDPVGLEIPPLSNVAVSIYRAREYRTRHLARGGDANVVRLPYREFHRERRYAIPFDYTLPRSERIRA